MENMKISPSCSFKWQNECFAQAEAVRPDIFEMMQLRMTMKGRYR